MFRHVTFQESTNVKDSPSRARVRPLEPFAIHKQPAQLGCSITTRSRGNTAHSTIDQPDEMDLPPQDLEAERCVLGCLLMVNESMSEVSPIVGVECFYTDGHRRIYKVFVEMFEAQGGGIDAVTLRDELTRRNEMEAVGGVTYIERLLETVPHAAHAEYYAKIVRQKSDQRRALDVIKRATYELRQPGADTFAIIARLSENLQTLGDAKAEHQFPLTTIGELMVKDIAPAEFLIDGFLVSQQLAVFIGPPKTFKTTFAMHMAVGLATGTHVLGYMVPKPLRVSVYLPETPEYVGCMSAFDFLFPPGFSDVR